MSDYIGGKTEEGLAWLLDRADEEIGPEQDEISIETDRSVNYCSLTRKDLVEMLTAIDSK